MIKFLDFPFASFGAGEVWKNAGSRTICGSGFYSEQVVFRVVFDKKKYKRLWGLAFDLICKNNFSDPELFFV